MSRFRVLMVDNYDSFTYNLVHYFKMHQCDVDVYLNDKITVHEIQKLAPDAIVLSPGPGHPKDATLCLDIIKQLAPTYPILGICLGHQAIGLAHGCQIRHATAIMHGKVSAVYHHGHELFQTVGNPFSVTRYHSLVIDRASLPDSLIEIAWTGSHEREEVMGIRHQHLPLFGLQFHPESYLTKSGLDIIGNFVQMARTIVKDKGNSCAIECL